MSSQPLFHHRTLEVARSIRVGSTKSAQALTSATRRCLWCCPSILAPRIDRWTRLPEASRYRLARSEDTSHQLVRRHALLAAPAPQLRALGQQDRHPGSHTGSRKFDSHRSHQANQTLTVPLRGGLDPYHPHFHPHPSYSWTCRVSGDSVTKATIHFVVPQRGHAGGFTS